MSSPGEKVLAAASARVSSWNWRRGERENTATMGSHGCCHTGMTLPPTMMR